MAPSPNEFPMERERDETLRSAGQDASSVGAPVDFLPFVRAAESVAESNIGAVQREQWRTALLAFRNEHAIGSKYRSEFFRNRTRLFRPKTRAAVRKNLAAVASAFFSSSDVLSATAENDSNLRKTASAAVIKELLNYRLDRTATRSGIPWFLTVVGAALDAQLHGISVSKQFWEYEERVRKVKRQRFVPATDLESGEPLIDVATGETAMQAEEYEEEVVERVKDRPMCLLLPPENVLIDPAAPWHDPAQGSSYLILRFPMTLEEARTFLRNAGKSNEEWLALTDEQLTRAAEDYSARGVRLTRDAGPDRYSQRPEPATGGRSTARIVWLQENFIRYDGTDYHFWSVGSSLYASRCRTTEEAYPEQMGQRPVVYGYGAIETHRIAPMSPVMSWQEMQRETNDVVNLSLDAMKQALSPIAIVRQGTTFDWKQLQRRAGADTTIITRNPESDIRFERPPDPSGTAYIEQNRLNADFDDLSGTFSAGSVQTNRQLNETVGGLHLLAGSANAVTEFDLRIFSETWVEPVLRQLVRLEQYYEDDQTVLSIAGERARLLERFGVDRLTDEDLAEEVSIRVNVGIGATDPMQRFAKIGAALKVLAPLVPMADRPVKVNIEEAVKEIFGIAGYNDGTRFIVFGDPGTPSPSVAAEQAKAELERQKMATQERIARDDRLSEMEREQLRARVQIIDSVIREMAAANQQRRQAQFDITAMAMERLVDILAGKDGRDARPVPPQPPMPYGGEPGMAGTTGGLGG
jgi:hypothetical protein